MRCNEIIVRKFEENFDKLKITVRRGWWHGYLSLTEGNIQYEINIDDWDRIIDVKNYHTKTRERDGILGLLGLKEEYIGFDRESVKISPSQEKRIKAIYKKMKAIKAAKARQKKRQKLEEWGVC